MGIYDQVQGAFGNAWGNINNAFGGPYGINTALNLGNPMLPYGGGYGYGGGGGGYGNPMLDSLLGSQTQNLTNLRNNETAIYGIDSGERQNSYGWDTRKDIAGIEGDTARDVAGIGLEGSKYNTDMQRDNNILNNATTRYGIDQKTGVDLAGIGKDIYGIDTGYDIANLNNQSDRYKADTDRYGFDVGREVAGIKDRGDTQRTGIGAAASVLPDFLKDAQRREVLGSPLMQSLLGNSLGGVMSGALGAMSGQGGSMPAGSFKMNSPYDASAVMGSLLDQINKPQVYQPTVAQFTPGQAPAPPPRVAERPAMPQAPIPQPTAPAPVAAAAAPQAAPTPAAAPQTRYSALVRQNGNTSLQRPIPATQPQQPHPLQQQMLDKFQRPAPAVKPPMAALW